MIYKTSSNIQFILLLLIRIGYVLSIAFFLKNYNDNPFVIIILSFIFLVFLLVSGNDEIIVYTDRFIFVDGSIIKLFQKKKIVKISDLKSITVIGDYGKADELFVPKFGSKSDTNQIVLHFANNEKEMFDTTIYIENLTEVVKVINKLMR